ncbi:4-hydroxyphenylacetate 3-monooxygenase oxygenase component [Geodia barretti]|uniref:4-hydroxyphenylacetate 3-monooxygenase oxygenase component n=1 Tax=Geodia barretti TaxID=519541 RepID=A0AA35T523_GEOBA|nr:4-hydroxyphenylacetate 3-monooxygenase oxygenase component [Geodia barretti]
MPARTGKEYIAGLRDRPREVWIEGERVKDVTTHPGLRNGVKAVAALYDMQHDPGLREEMTFASPSTGDPVGLSFQIPRTAEDLVRKREMMSHWAWASCGMMGRSPDFMNSIFTAWAGSADYFAQDRPEFKQNVVDYHEFLRENDVTLTHALVNLQRSRTPAAADNLTGDVALTAVKQTDAGLVVRGSRVLATLGPISDEIAIYPVASHRLADDDWKHSFSFSIPCDTPGVKFLCRQSLDEGRSHFDHPLGSRFEEMDTVVFFDDVLVPWERVFLLGNVELCNNYGTGTQSNAHTGYQEQVAEIITYRDMLRACVRAAEADARPNQWGMMCPAMGPIQAGRALFGRTLYPAHDRDHPVAGHEQPDGAAGRGGLRRRHRAGGQPLPGHRLDQRLGPRQAVPPGLGRVVQLVQRAAGAVRADVWRQPVRNAMMLFNNYDKEPFRQKVQEFLALEN